MSKNANTSESDTSKDVVEMTLEASKDASEIERLSATIDKVASAQAHDAIDYEVAACAMCFDKLDKMITRNTFIALSNERCNFESLKSNTSSEREVSYDAQDTVHRNYVLRIEVRKQHNNDALMIVRVRRSNKKHVSTAREHAVFSYRLLSMMLSEQARALYTVEKLDAIVEAYASADYKRAYKASKRASKK